MNFTLAGLLGERTRCLMLRLEMSVGNTLMALLQLPHWQSLLIGGVMIKNYSVVFRLKKPAFMVSVVLIAQPKSVRISVESFFGSFLIGQE